MTLQQLISVVTITDTRSMNKAAAELIGQIVDVSLDECHGKLK